MEKRPGAQGKGSAEAKPGVSEPHRNRNHADRGKEACHGGLGGAEFVVPEPDDHGREPVNEDYAGARSEARGDVGRKPRQGHSLEHRSSVLARSSNCVMLFMPPSTVCRLARPSLAFWIPCVRTAWSAASPLAMARPAASSPELTMRRPDVTSLMVFA